MINDCQWLSMTNNDYQNKTFIFFLRSRQPARSLKSRRFQQILFWYWRFRIVLPQTLAKSTSCVRPPVHFQGVGWTRSFEVKISSPITNNDSQWLLMTIDDFQWLSMTINDYQWLPTTINDYQWVSMSSIEYQGLLMTTNDWQRLPMTFNDYNWLPMTFNTNDYQWLSMTIDD